MNDLRAAAQQALETLEKSRVFVTAREKIKHPEGTEWYDGTIAALRDALAQQEQEQEPVAWMVYTQDGKAVCVTDNPADFTNEHRALPLYTHPPRREAEQQEQADYPEEKLQSVAEYISDKYHVWYGVAARDIEEVLRQSVSCGLVSNPPRHEAEQQQEQEPVEIKPPNPEGATQCIVRWFAETPAGWVGAWDREALERFTAHPPRREWVSLTEEEMHGLYRRAGLEAYYPRDGAVQYEYERRFDAYARAIEAALKERNT